MEKWYLREIRRVTITTEGKTRSFVIELSDGTVSIGLIFGTLLMLRPKVIRSRKKELKRRKDKTMNWKRYTMFKYWQLRDKKMIPALSYRCGCKMKNMIKILGGRPYNETKFYGI